MSKIAILSGKGGTGKTTVLVNLASSASRKTKQVQILDCDVEAPNADLFIHSKKIKSQNVEVLKPEILSEKCTYCGICQEVCEFNAIAILKKQRQSIIFNELCHSCGACTELCPEKAIIETPTVIGRIDSGEKDNLKIHSGFLNISEMMAPTVIKKVKSHAQTPGVNFIDSSPGTSCPVVQSVYDADYCVLVTEPTPFGLYDLGLAVSLLDELKRRYSVVINKSNENDRLIEEFCSEKGIEILGKLPFDEEIARGYSEGEIIFQRKEYQEIFNNIYEKIIERLKE